MQTALRSKALALLTLDNVHLRISLRSKALVKQVQSTNADARQRAPQDLRKSLIQGVVGDAVAVLTLLALLVQKYKYVTSTKVQILPHRTSGGLSGCTQFTCFTGAKVQILTHNVHRVPSRRRRRRRKRRRS
jgi:hypothetical protein